MLTDSNDKDENPFLQKHKKQQRLTLQESLIAAVVLVSILPYCAIS